MRRTRTSVIIGLATFGLATAAFAGVAAAGELSKSEYKAEINDRCASATEEFDEVFTEVFGEFEEGEELSPSQIEAAAEAALPIFRQLLDDVEDLDGPNALEKKVGKLVGQYRDVADDIEADPEIAFTGDDDPFEKADKQAEKLGLDECAQG